MGYRSLPSVLEVKPNVPCAPLLGLTESPRRSCLLLAKLILAASSVSIHQPNHIWIWVAKAYSLSSIFLEHVMHSKLLFILFFNALLTMPFFFLMLRLVIVKANLTGTKRLTSVDIVCTDVHWHSFSEFTYSSWPKKANLHSTWKCWK